MFYDARYFNSFLMALQVFQLPQSTKIAWNWTFKQCSLKPPADDEMRRTKTLQLVKIFFQSISIIEEGKAGIQVPEFCQSSEEVRKLSSEQVIRCPAETKDTKSKNYLEIHHVNLKTLYYNTQKLRELQSLKRFQICKFSRNWSTDSTAINMPEKGAIFNQIVRLASKIRRHAMIPIN